MSDEPASITILRGVQVMAIEDKTVVSQEENESRRGKSSNHIKNRQAARNCHGGP